MTNERQLMNNTIDLYAVLLRRAVVISSLNTVDALESICIIRVVGT